MADPDAVKAAAQAAAAERARKAEEARQAAERQRQAQAAAAQRQALAKAAAARLKKLELMDKRDAAAQKPVDPAAAARQKELDRQTELARSMATQRRNAEAEAARYAAMPTNTPKPSPLDGWLNPKFVVAKPLEPKPVDLAPKPAPDPAQAAKIQEAADAKQRQVQAQADAARLAADARAVVVKPPPVPGETTAVRKAKEDSAVAQQALLQKQADEKRSQAAVAAYDAAVATAQAGGADPKTVTTLLDGTVKASHDSDAAAQHVVDARSTVDRKQVVLDAQAAAAKLHAEQAAVGTGTGSEVGRKLADLAPKVTLADTAAAQAVDLDAKGQAVLDANQYFEKRPVDMGELNARVEDLNAKAAKGWRPKNEAERQAALQTIADAEAAGKLGDAMNALQGAGTPGSNGRATILETVFRSLEARDRAALIQLDPTASKASSAPLLGMINDASSGRQAAAAQIDATRNQADYEQSVIAAGQQTQTALKVIGDGKTPMDPFAEATLADQEVLNNGRLWYGNRDTRYVDIPADYNPILGQRPPALADGALDAQGGTHWTVTPAAPVTIDGGGTVSDIAVTRDASGRYTLDYKVDGQAFTGRTMSALDARMWENAYRLGEGEKGLQEKLASIGAMHDATDRAIQAWAHPGAPGSTPATQGAADTLVQAFAREQDVDGQAGQRLAPVQVAYGKAANAGAKTELDLATAALDAKTREIGHPGAILPPDRRDELLAPFQQRVDAARTQVAASLTFDRAAFDALHPIADPQRYTELSKDRFAQHHDEIAAITDAAWSFGKGGHTTLDSTSRDETKRFVQSMTDGQGLSEGDVDQIVDGIYHQGMFQGRPDWQGPLHVEASPVVYGDGQMNIVFRVDQTNVATRPMPGRYGTMGQKVDPHFSMLVDVDGQTYSNEQDYRDNNRTMDPAGMQWSVMLKDGQRGTGDLAARLSAGDSRNESGYETFTREHAWVEPVAAAALTVGGIAISATGVGASVGLPMIAGGVTAAVGVGYGLRAANNRIQASIHNRSQTDREAVYDWVGIAAMPLGAAQGATTRVGLQLVRGANAAEDAGRLATVARTAGGAALIGAPAAGLTAPVPMMVQDMANPNLSGAERAGIGANLAATILGLGHGTHASFRAARGPLPEGGAVRVGDDPAAARSPALVGADGKPLGDVKKVWAMPGGAGGEPAYYFAWRGPKEGMSFFDPQGRQIGLEQVAQLRTPPSAEPRYRVGDRVDIRGVKNAWPVVDGEGTTVAYLAARGLAEPATFLDPSAAGRPKNAPLPELPAADAAALQAGGLLIPAGRADTLPALRSGTVEVDAAHGRTVTFDGDGIVFREGDRPMTGDEVATLLDADPALATRVLTDTLRGLGAKKGDAKALAVVDLPTGVADRVAYAMKSGEDDRPGLVANRPNHASNGRTDLDAFPAFTARRADGETAFPRAADAEKKFFESLGRELRDHTRRTGQDPASIEGTVKVYADRAICDSCSLVARQFENAYPRIRVEVKALPKAETAAARDAAPPTGARRDGSPLQPRNPRLQKVVTALRAAGTPEARELARRIDSGELQVDLFRRDPTKGGREGFFRAGDDRLGIVAGLFRQKSPEQLAGLAVHEYMHWAEGRTTGRHTVEGEMNAYRAQGRIDRGHWSNGLDDAQLRARVEHDRARDGHGDILSARGRRARRAAAPNAQQGQGTTGTNRPRRAAAAAKPPRAGKARVAGAATAGVAATAALSGLDAATIGSLPPAAVGTLVASGVALRSVIKAARYGDANLWRIRHDRLTENLTRKISFEKHLSRLVDLAGQKRGTSSPAAWDGFRSALDAVNSVRPTPSTRAATVRLRGALRRLGDAAERLGVDRAEADKLVHEMKQRANGKIRFDHALARHEQVLDRLGRFLRGVPDARRAELRDSIAQVRQAEAGLKGHSPAAYPQHNQAMRDAVGQVKDFGAEVRPRDSGARKAVDAMQVLTYSGGIGALVHGAIDGTLPLDSLGTLASGLFAAANALDAIKISGLRIDDLVGWMKQRGPGTPELGDSALFQKALSGGDDLFSAGAGATSVALGAMLASKGLPPELAKTIVDAVHGGGSLVYTTGAGMQLFEGARRGWKDPSPEQRRAFLVGRVVAGAGALALAASSLFGYGETPAATAPPVTPPNAGSGPTAGPSQGTPPVGGQQDPKQPRQPTEKAVEALIRASGRDPAVSGSLWAIASHHRNWILSEQDQRRLGGRNAVDLEATRRLARFNGFDPNLMDGRVTGAKGDPDLIPEGFRVDVNVLGLKQPPTTPG